MTRSPADVAQDLGAAASDVATALYNLENTPDMVFVRMQSDGGNPEAQALTTSLGLAWERYTLLKESVDSLDAAVAHRRGLEIDTLLGPSAVHLPDGTTIGIAQLAEDIQLRVGQISPRLTALAGAARQAVAALDTAQVAAGQIFARATAIGAEHDVEITTMRAALDRAVAAISTDPSHATAATLADLDRVVDDARRRVSVLELHRQTVPAALDEAAAQLAAIEAAVARAAEALALNRAKMAPSAGLVDPPDLTVAADRSLRPWLGRIQAQADSGEWEGAAAGISGWKAAADACLSEAERAAQANAAPLARRNELRGLLDAYRAKAAAIGHDEDGRLDRLYAAARDVLYTAPCALDRAEAVVRDYVATVNMKSSER